MPDTDATSDAETTGSRQRLALGLVLSAVAGFVDAAGFVFFGGVFVSFMSGNTTALGVELAGPNPTVGTLGLSVIGAFVTGAFAGTLLQAAGGLRLHRALPLAAEAGLLILVAALTSTGGQHQITMAALLAFSMGIQNASRQQVGHAQLGATFVTGTLVGFGQSLAEWMLGKSHSWPAAHAVNWFALLVGAVTGAGLARSIRPDIVFVVPSVALFALAVIDMLRKPQKYPAAREQQRAP